MYVTDGDMSGQISSLDIKPNVSTVRGELIKKI